MSYIIDYSLVSPSVLESIVRNATCNALCIWKDLNENFFEFSIMGWLPLTQDDLIAIEKALAPYV